MSNKHATPVRTAPRAAPDPAPPSTALDEFSRALAGRLPGRLVMHFVMPSKVRECREVFIQELTSQDEVQAAMLTDQVISDIERRSTKLTLEAERRESIKLAIVGLGELNGSSVAYRHVNADGAPFAEPDGWSLPAWTALHRYFSEVNGVPNEELTEGIEGARTVGAFASPTSATRASADTGRSGASSGATT